MICDKHDPDFKAKTQFRFQSCCISQKRCLCTPPSAFQLKQMEVQLEEEYDEKQKVMKEKRELESKLLSAEDRVGPSSRSALLSLTHAQSPDLTATCPAGEGRRRGDGEASEERPEENQSPAGGRSDHAGAHKEQRAQQEGDRPAEEPGKLTWTLLRHT